VTTAAAPEEAQAGAVVYGPGLNTAAVVLASYGNGPPERAAQVIGMRLGVAVSGGFVDKANARLDALLRGSGVDAALGDALAREPVLGADESPVNVLAPAAGPRTGQEEAGSPHVMVVRTPDERLTWLQALASRRKEAIIGLLSFVTGFLIVDGYTTYQNL